MHAYRVSRVPPETHATNLNVDGEIVSTITYIFAQRECEREKERERGWYMEMEQLICIIHNLWSGAESAGF